MKMLMRKFKNNIYYIVFYLAIYVNPAHAVIYVGAGFNAIGSDDVSITTTSTGSSGTVLNVFAPSFFGISNSTATTGFCSNLPDVTTIDGYSGIEVSPGVLFVIYDSTLISTAAVENGATVTQTATFNNKGGVSSAQGTKSGSKICYDVRSDVYQKLKQNFVRSTSGTLKFGLYVSPGVDGSVGFIMPNMSVVKLNSGATLVKHVFSLAGENILSSSLTCNITPPSSINFGDVNLNETNQGLFQTYQTGNLAVNCQNGSPSAKSTMTISFSATDVLDNKKLIMRRDSDNTVSAYIKGRLASPYGGTCANYASGDVLFDGSVSKTVSVGNGQTIIPLTWSLCKNPSDDLVTGVMSAQTTVSIDWD